MIARAALCLVLFLATASAAASAPPLVTLDRFDGVVPSMSVSQVERALGVDLELQLLPGSTCGTSRLGVPGLAGYALFIDGRLGSLWFSRGARTDQGIRIGSTLAAVRRAYPTSRARPDHYIPDALNVFVRRAKAPHWRLRFDVSPRGLVTGIAFGNDTVFLVEGCA